MVELTSRGGSNPNQGVRAPDATTIRSWLAQTFAGLTPVRLAVFGVVVVVIALSRPAVYAAFLAGKSLGQVAQTAIIPLGMVSLRFAPVLLVVVAAANRGPRSGWRQIVTLAGALLVGETIGTILMALVLHLFLPDAYLARVVDLNAPLATQVRNWFSISLSDLATYAVATGFWYYLKRNAEAAAALQQAQQDREETRRENAEARLLMLHAQIEPHFLFNTLASIRRLYETDPVSGERMLQHLSSYLAASLPTMRATRSTLGRELALAEAYLNVQKMRMGPRLTVEIDVPGALHAIEIPPMMLATLVENAIIHGLGPLPEGGRIRIHARAAGGRLVIGVADNGCGLTGEWGAGVGLANIDTRLHSQFGERASLALAHGPHGGVEATIELPLPEAPEALAA